MLALLEILQSGGTRTVGDLAARVGVDERTVRRYVVHLAELGIPVRSVRGRYGGYRLAPGYRMPPLMLTDDEALAVLLGLVAGRRAGLVTTSVAAAESAAAKVQRVLPEALGHRLDALLQTTDFTVRSRPVIELETTVLLLLAEAARDRKPVAISYTSPNGRRSERTVHPYGIVAHSGRWYVTGADSASGETRTFRLDRITTPELQAGTFDLPDGFDPAQRVLSGLAEAPHRHAVSLRVHGTAEQVRSRLPAGIATVHDIADVDGWVRVRLRAERLDWVPPVLAGLGLPFTVERPEALRGLIRSLAERLAAAADTVHTGEPTPDGEVVDRDPT
jgi:predicted DNA-binding transcriptional regulator YafY